nr:ParB/RepB/Spo0J family partition protein [Sulfobacillus harzensis]
MVPVDRIQVNPYQPRRQISAKELSQLVESIHNHGVIQPIVVSPVERGYQLIAGERRFRAARMAGLTRIPAVVRRADGETSAVLALVENLHRQSLSYWDEAEGFLRLHTEFHWTQSQIAETMGLSQSAVANKLRLLQLDRDIRRRIQEAGLTERHARVLLSLQADQERRTLLTLMIDNKWTVRQAEEWIAHRARGRNSHPATKAVVKDFRIVYNAFKKTLSAVEEAGMAVEMTQHEDSTGWEIRVRIPKNREG